MGERQALGSAVSFGFATSFNSHPTVFYGNGHLSGSVTLALAANDYVELYLDEDDADGLIIGTGSTLTLEQLVV